MNQSKLYYSYPQIVLQEVPGEITLALSISGCKLACKGCHSTETWNPFYGSPLTNTSLASLITKHKHISCVLFYGGEWEPEALIKLLQLCKTYELKTCLYTGQEIESIPSTLLAELTFIKTGRYIEELGGLNSPNTNQRFITIESITHTKEHL